MKTVLADMNPSQLASWCREQGLPAFRGKQLFRQIHRGADFDAMSDLPLALRARLKETAVAQPVRTVTVRTSRLDGTRKLLFNLEDGNCVEGVLMRYHHGHTLCISTQVGCRMGCLFCASTLEGCVRNLSAGEMLGEIFCANRLLAEDESLPAEDRRVHNVVLMGSGEPLDNYAEVISFLRLLREEDGVNIGLRGVSLSTCGLVPQMRALAGEGLPVTLSVSLHAPNDAVRARIMPIARTYPMQEVLSAARYYIEKTGRRVIFEYALISNVNADEKDARELASRLRGMQCHVNLIPLNSVPERGLKGVSEGDVVRFMDTLSALHISATRRREMGDDIDGACGQLRRKVLARPAAPSPEGDVF